VHDGDGGSAHIGRVNLRVHGPDAAFGRRVGQGVGALLEREVPDVAGDLGAVTLRVTVPRGTTESDISQAVARSIARALTRRER
jgi:hypothetical protein